MHDRIAKVAGVVGVVLGGSRARGTHRPDSDHDIGIYYRGELDVAALRELAGEVADEPAELTGPGGWGPWVDGGGWLRVGGEKVDWIYRDLDRVRSVWADCREGRYEIGFQVGHPLGFASYAYAGELALARILADPTGELTALRAETRVYPPRLAAALTDRLWEAEFLFAQARKGHDPTYAAGCLFRAVGVMCHAVLARRGRWLLNEKGMLAAAGLPELLGEIGRTPAEVEQTIRRAEAVLAEIRDQRR
jgi:nucleotidyltransferase-like protein